MADTVRNKYSYNGDESDVDDSVEPPNSHDMERTERKPHGCRDFTKTARKVVIDPLMKCKARVMHDHSSGWKEFGGGLFGCQKNSKTVCLCSACCCCCLHGVNASDVVVGPEGKWEKDNQGKRIGLYFVCEQAMLFLMCPCASGGAIREKIWANATEAGGQEVKSTREKMSFCKECQTFCIPYCLCPCLAVTQDRRALSKSLKILDAIRKKKNAPSFAMNMPPHSNHHGIDNSDDDDKNHAEQAQGNTEEDDDGGTKESMNSST